MALETISNFLGVDKGAIIAPLSVIGTSTIGFSIALYTIFTNRKNARQKNSMDFINGFNETESISAALKEVRKLQGQSSNVLSGHASNSDCAEYQNIRSVLNYFESMSVCISHGIYDDTIIKETMFTTVTDVWQICKPWIDERRRIKHNNKFYQELEILVVRWKAKPLKLKLKN